jgi:hypothetical protein
MATVVHHAPLLIPSISRIALNIANRNTDFETRLPA